MRDDLPLPPSPAWPALTTAELVARKPDPTTFGQLRRIPVSIVLDDVRSLANVGLIFRICDALRVERLYLCGITGYPPKHAISKTALGADETVPWEHAWEPLPMVQSLRERGYELAAIETTVHAVDLFDWSPRFPVCLVFGHEVEGVRPEISALCDTHVRIPMLGAKHSLNVATAGGVVIYELLRKYRALGQVTMNRA